MPWRAWNIMDQRELFVLEWLSGECPKGALCAAYGSSRPTGDKWVARYHASRGMFRWAWARGVIR